MIVCMCTHQPDERRKIISNGNTVVLEARRAHTHTHTFISLESFPLFSISLQIRFFTLFFFFLLSLLLNLNDERANVAAWLLLNGCISGNSKRNLARRCAANGSLMQVRSDSMVSSSPTPSSSSSSSSRRADFLFKISHEMINSLIFIDSIESIFGFSSYPVRASANDYLIVVVVHHITCILNPISNAIHSSYFQNVFVGIRQKYLGLPSTCINNGERETHQHRASSSEFIFYFPLVSLCVCEMVRFVSNAVDFYFTPCNGTPFVVGHRQAETIIFYLSARIPWHNNNN